MDKELIGLVSGSMVAISVIPYAVRTYQRKITPNLTTWSLWTLIGFTLLLTYKSSGAEANVWPAVFGFINPLVVTLLIITRQHGRLVKPDRVEVACAVISVTSFCMWLGLRQSKELVQFALFCAIVADACASGPTIKSIWAHPEAERPFMWGVFAIGYGLSVFAITEHTVANYVLPLFMCFPPLIVAFFLVQYRVKRKIPLLEWV